MLPCERHGIVAAIIAALVYTAAFMVFTAEESRSLVLAAWVWGAPVVPACVFAIASREVGRE